MPVALRGVAQAAILLPFAQVRKQIRQQMGQAKEEGNAALTKILAFTACLPLCAADPEKAHVDGAMQVYYSTIQSLRKQAAAWTDSVVGGVG